ncbi:MAG: hypothetical protein H6765_01735 [Candidatus Peribacteria bacterium]|nr:MAG: hypothetical protein H6765_01735 [Candidatus Peribacteria bacterium]
MTEVANHCNCDLRVLAAAFAAVTSAEKLAMSLAESSPLGLVMSKASLAVLQSSINISDV